MKNLIKISIICAFLISMSANSVNAQNCSDPSCPFNNVQMNGPTDMIYVGGYGIYSLPNVYGASYAWSSNFLSLKFHGNGHAQFEVAPDAENGDEWDLLTICYYKLNANTNNYDPKCFKTAYQWWWPYNTSDVIECTVTYNGHTHYFYKFVFIWKNYGW